MKKNKIIFTLLVVLLITSFSAQAQHIKVTYQEFMSDKDFAAMKKQIPLVLRPLISKKSAVAYYLLSYSNGVSISIPLAHTEETNGIPMSSDATGPIFYQNQTTSEYIKQIEFLSRTFLIEDSLRPLAWQIKSETKQIGDYTCQKAVLQEDSLLTIAWYTTDIPVSAGPRKYRGLPGLIIQMDNDGAVTSASKIEFLDEPIEIKAPTKGKKVSPKEFAKIKAEKSVGREEDDGDMKVIIEEK